MRKNRRWERAVPWGRSPTCRALLQAGWQPAPRKSILTVGRILAIQIQALSSVFIILQTRILARFFLGADRLGEITGFGVGGGEDLLGFAVPVLVQRQRLFGQCDRLLAVAILWVGARCQHAGVM